LLFIQHHQAVLPIWAIFFQAFAKAGGNTFRIAFKHHNLSILLNTSSFTQAFSPSAPKDPTFARLLKMMPGDGQHGPASAPKPLWTPPAGHFPTGDWKIAVINASRTLPHASRKFAKKFPALERCCTTGYHCR
jgi:hypothetical protein